MDLDNLLGLTPFKEKDDEREEVEGGEEAAPAEESPAPEPEPGEDEAPEPLVAGDGEPAPVEGEPAPEVESKAEGDGDDQDRDESRDALLKELKRLRQQLATQKPVAPEAQQTTAPGVRPVPVRVSDDGSQVFVDPAALAEFTRQAAREEAIRATMPTPEQMVSQRLSQVDAEFSASGPNNKRAVDLAKDADTLISGRISELRAQGYQMASLDDAVQALRLSGADQEIERLIPRIKDIGLGDFIEGMASGIPSVRRMILRQLAEPEPSRSRQRQRAPKENGAPRELGRQPRSMSRKGGGRETSATSDEAEFKALEGDFTRNPFNFPDKKYNRLQSLGKKLGVDGY